MAYKAALNVFLKIVSPLEKLISTKIKTTKRWILIKGLDLACVEIRNEKILDFKYKKNLLADYKKNC